MRLSLPRLKMPRLPGFSILVWISTALKGWVMGSREKDTDSLIMYDRTLLWLTFGLAASGFIMVTSASMPIGQRLTNDPFFFAKRDGVYLILAFILAIITLSLPMEFWQRYSATMLLGSIILLMIVLVVGSSVKGASRWIDLGLLRIQFFFAKRDGVYLILAFILAIITLRLPMEFWQRYSATMLLGSIILLMIVLVVGSSVKGASRWIDLGLLRIQPAELTKLSLFCYIANYLVRKGDEVRNNLRGFLKPMGVILVLAVLLLAQPDLGTVVVLFVTTLAMLFLAGAKLWQFIAIIGMGISLLLAQPDLGTVVVLFVTTLAMLFLAGAKLWQFIAIIGMGISAVVLLILAEPYRIRRVTAFWNPWEDPFGSGYQLTQSLMAFGRGELWGQGLGNSVQKLEYLPEAHTDFIFAIIGEELGYVGVVLALIMVLFVAFRAMSIGLKELEIDHSFSGFLACSIGIWFSFQALVNVGAAAGMLPTKGLTLPLISYGGSSLL